MARFRRVPFGHGELVLALDVDPREVALQPGDLSVSTAAQRAEVIQAKAAKGPLPPPHLRVNARGQLEVWDGNARLHYYRSRNEHFDALVVDPTGHLIRQMNPTVPTDRALYDALVAEVRGLVDAGQVNFAWPSDEAKRWILHEYELQGGRWARPRRPRPRPAERRREASRFRQLYDQAEQARDIWEIASVLAAARVDLETILLVGVVELKGVNRAKELGFSCPGRQDCADALVEMLESRQRTLFNPSPAIPVKGDPESKKFARWGLEARRAAPKSRKGGLDTQEAGHQQVGSGVARARDIVSGKSVNAQQVKAYFDRHEGFYHAALRRAHQRMQVEGVSLRHAARQEPAIQGWWLWGGDPMRERAIAAMRTHESTSLR